MGIFWKATAAALISLVLILSLGGHSRDIGTVLSMAACAMICASAFVYLEPVLEFLRDLQSMGEMQADVLDVLLKALGIGLVSEVCTLVCADSGNGSLGKIVQLLGSAAILYLSLPVFRAFLALIQEILGGI